MKQPSGGASLCFTWFHFTGLKRNKQIAPHLVELGIFLLLLAGKTTPQSIACSRNNTESAQKAMPCVYMDTLTQTHTGCTVVLHENVAALSVCGLASLSLTGLSQQVTTAVNQLLGGLVDGWMDALPGV